ncbi:MAG: hypothetical protein HY814_14270 [Candidatus Riflebacteria bacterium]|nr:hypothetical protein [Candidatus Riflebacteria bacterium]
MADPTLSEILQRLDRIESLLNLGRQAQASATDLRVELAAYLGPYTPSVTSIGAWLALGKSPEEIKGAIDRLLETRRLEATSPGAPGGDWRLGAAYLVTAASHQGWSQIDRYLATGEWDAPSPSYDPLPSVFAGISRKLTKKEMVRFVPEVLARAEKGITWAGTQGRFGEDLEKARRALEGSDFRKEWEGFSDLQLLSVLVLTGHLKLEDPVLFAYALDEGLKGMELREWLWYQWRASSPFPGSPAWNEG